ncbi:MAG: ABC transporter substrate-binding protein, partial [Oscillospiraceae bacterium]
MKTLKKLLTLTLSLALVFTLASCTPAPGGDGPSKPTEPVADGKQLKVGIIQYAPHPSLDNCTNGFIQGLADGGYVDGENIAIDLQNASGEVSNADLMAKNMVAAGYDMIAAVATPAAMSAYAAVRGTDIPVVFVAVADPVATGVVKTLEAPETGATGTADTLNLEGQLKMIRAFLPDAKTIGILYTTSEPNSVSNLKRFEELAPQYDFTIQSVGITSAAEVASGAAALVAKGVDCVNNFTDNNVVNQLSSLLHATDEAKIPVFGSEIEQVKNGCVAAESIDYLVVGAKSGTMAANILGGTADAKTLAVEVVSQSEPVYSAKACAKFGITLPADYQTATDTDQ